MSTRRLTSQVSTLGLLMLAGVFPSTALGDVRSKAARETAEFVIERFGKETAKEGAESLARRIESMVVKHGDEAIEAIRKLGPKTFRLVEEAGIHGTKVVKIMARFGDDAVVWVVERPKGMAIFVKYGESAVETLVKHKSIAEPLIGELGEPAIRAFQGITRDKGILLAKLGREGQLTRIGRVPEVLDVIGRFGDSAMEFVWRHKVPLAIATTLAAFLLDPKPFIDGAKDITSVVTENVAKPAIDATGRALQERVADGSTNWMAYGMVVGFSVLAGLLTGIRWLKNKLSTR